jgi:peptide chain release factor 2
MYLRWAERKGLDTELENVSPGSEAGISSASFLVKGRYAYGLMRSEHGVHRLVRMSPFNAQGKRQTAFAALKVTPFLEDVPDIVIEDKDLRVDTYRSSGAGGQHVNVTDSAVRLTHIPTGVVTTCQNQRSQHQNKDKAMQYLKAKLAELQREERQAELDAIRGVQHSVGFGSQIRSYVMQPYQMVKDLRTEHETGNVDGVLDGNLDEFMEAYLRWQRSQALDA